MVALPMGVRAGGPSPSGLQWHSPDGVANIGHVAQKTMSHVREINCIGELAGYRSAWRQLLAETPGACFFQSLEWLEVYWRYFGADADLRVLVVEDDSGNPTGILPMRLYLERSRLGPMRLLTYPLHDWGAFYGPIGPDPRDTLAEGLAHVRRKRRDWDAVELRWLGCPRTDLRHTEDAFRGAGMAAYPTVWAETALVDLAGAGDWTTYFAGRTGSLRNNFRRRQKKLAARGELRFERYRPGGSEVGEMDPRWDLYEHCERLAGQSWQAAMSFGTTLSSDSVRPFLRDVHQAAIQCGAADLNLLWLDDRPLAFAYNYHYRGHVSGLRVGYDQEFARQGVGSLLWLMSLRDSFERGDWLYDMGVGSLQSKRHYRTHIVPVFRFSHYPAASLLPNVLRLKRLADGYLLGADAALALDEGSSDPSWLTRSS